MALRRSKACRAPAADGRDREHDSERFDRLDQGADESGKDRGRGRGPNHVENPR
jgi:hypothetical protein